MKNSRKELILQTIDEFGVVSVKQLHEILELGTYRYTCKLVQELEDYLEIERTKQKKIHLNKNGREFIGSTKIIDNESYIYYSNQVYLYFKQPKNWQKEVELTVVPSYDGIEVKGLKIIDTYSIIVPAIFYKGSSLCLVELDLNRSMEENENRINNYRKIIPHLKHKYMLFFFTQTQGRKRRLEDLLEGLTGEVFILNE